MRGIHLAVRCRAMLLFTMPNLTVPHFTATSPFFDPLPFLSLLHEIIPKYTRAKSGKWISWGKDDLLTCLSDRSQLQVDRNYWRQMPLILVPTYKRSSLRRDMIHGFRKDTVGTIAGSARNNLRGLSLCCRPIPASGSEFDNRRVISGVIHVITSGGCQVDAAPRVRAEEDHHNRFDAGRSIQGA